MLKKTMKGGKVVRQRRINVLENIPRTWRERLQAAVAALSSANEDDLAVRGVADEAVRRVNSFGRTFSNGRPLSNQMRLKILTLAVEGNRPAYISKKLLVSPGCVSKIIKKFWKTGSFEKGRCGRRNPRYMEMQKQLMAMAVQRDQTKKNCRFNDNEVQKTSASAGNHACGCCEEAGEHGKCHEKTTLPRTHTNKHTSKGKHFETTDALQIHEQQPSGVELNHIVTSTTPTNTFRRDVVPHKKVSGRHYQELYVTDESSDCTISGDDIDEELEGHHHVNTIEDDGQVPQGNGSAHNHRQQTTAMDFHPTYNHGGSYSEPFKSSKPELPVPNIGGQVLDLSIESSYFDAHAINMTVPRCVHTSPAVRRSVSPAMLVPTQEERSHNEIMTGSRLFGGHSEEVRGTRKPEVLLLNGKQYEIVPLGGGLWLPKIEYEMMSHFERINVLYNDDDDDDDFENGDDMTD